MNRDRHEILGHFLYEEPIVKKMIETLETHGDFDNLDKTYEAERALGNAIRALITRERVLRELKEGKRHGS